jgi:hypothetical protein
MMDNTQGEKGQSTQAAPAETETGLAPAKMAAVATARTARFIDHQAARAGDVAWRLLRRRPYLGMAMAAGAAFVAATTIGVAEVAITVGAAYAAYQVLKLNVPPSKALRKTIELEEGLGA